MNIYVGNLPRSTGEADVRKAFEAHGEVSSVAIIMDKFSNESRGFGFVEMPNDTHGQAAISALNGQDLGGRNLTVSLAKPKAEGSRGGARRW